MTGGKGWGLQPLILWYSEGVHLGQFCRLSLRARRTGEEACRGLTLWRQLAPGSRCSQWKGPVADNSGRCQDMDLVSQQGPEQQRSESQVRMWTSSHHFTVKYNRRGRPQVFLQCLLSVRSPISHCAHSELYTKPMKHYFSHFTEEKWTNVGAETQL